MTPLPANPERIVAAIVDKLQTIRVAAGYKTDVERVYRVPMNVDQVPTGTFAALTVIPVAQRNAMAGRQHYKARLEMVVGGMVSQGEGDLLDPGRAVALNLLIADVINALNDDPTFGIGPHVDSVIGDPELEVDPDRGIALFGLPIHMTYYFSRGSL